MGKKLIIIAVLLIIIGFISFFLLSFMKDKSDNKKAMGVIESDYKVFENDVVEFNNYRDTIYEKVFTLIVSRHCPSELGHQCDLRLYVRVQSVVNGLYKQRDYGGLVCV